MRPPKPLGQAHIPSNMEPCHPTPANPTPRRSHEQWYPTPFGPQQRWFRQGGPTQWFPNVPLANRGLQRLGNAGFNLIPMPRGMNRWLGRHPWASFGVGVGVAGGGVGIVGASGYAGFQIGENIFGEWP